MTVIQLHPPHTTREEPAPFRLGINYWPACTGPAMFKRFDIDEVHSDLNNIAELGLDFVRVFLNWEDFQPEPDSVKCCALARLASLCDAAAAEGLKVIATLFTGHLMGHNWVPRWLLDANIPPFAGRSVISNGERVSSGYRDPLLDSQARKAALRLVRAVARTVVDHQALWAFDLGNAPDLFSHPLKTEVARDWYVELATALRNMDAHHSITCALGAHCLCRRDGLHINDACSSLNFGCIGEVTPEFDLATERSQPILAAFSCALAAELSGKPCLSASWNLATRPVHSPGGTQSTKLISEGAAVSYTEEVLPALVEVGAVGALVGSYSDFDQGLFDTAPLDTQIADRYRGIWRSDGSLKPHGNAIRNFAESNPVVQVPPKRRAQVDVSVSDFYESPLSHYQRLFNRFSLEKPPGSRLRGSTPVG